ITDWQVLLYTAGRAMLWVVVVSACLSMYQYFRDFYQAVSERTQSERATELATASARSLNRTLPESDKVLET
nr:hypothetical protein [Pyrinomonadaceae bacterium]